jgi:fructokinase
MSLRLGIDLGGSKIEIIALDARGNPVLRRRVPTPQGDYPGTVMAVVGLVEAAENELGQYGSVGVGIPGAESPASGLIKNANSTCLIGQPLRCDLQALLQREVRLANDANCFALSEATDGAGAGAESVFGVILGTGVGGGLVVRGRVLAGANRIAGEWGHNPLPAPGPDDLPLRPCYCGRTGCVETYLSGPATEAEYATRCGQSLSLQKIAANAALGDADCIQTLERYSERLARALAGVINIVDPDVIVLGGGVSQLAGLYDRVPAIWGRYIFSDSVATRLLPPRHGDSSGVRGAAWLWNA